MTIPVSRLLFPKFPAALEADFIREYNKQAAPVARIALLLGLAVYLSFYIWDRSVDLPHSFSTLLLRLAVAVVIVAALSIRRAIFEQHLQIIMMVCIVFAGFAHIAILTIVNHGFAIGIPGIVLILMYNFIFFRLLFIPALISGVVITLGHDLVAARYFLPPSEMVVDNFFIVSTLVSGAAVAYLLENLFRTQFATDRALETERSRANELIASLFPQAIVRRLTSGEKVIAESHGEVTVLFSDLVGFTTLTKKLSPGHLIDVLNDYFSMLDRLTEKHGVEKIKTIGDAYMVVSGLSEERSDSAEHIAEFALEMQAAIADYARQHDFPLALRVGISTGQVISGIIGMKKPTFDLWGDTVNLASRMESHSEVGQIQVSEATYWRLHEKYRLSARGEIEIKGLGKTQTYFLVGRKAAEAPAVTQATPAAAVAAPVEAGRAKAAAQSAVPLLGG